MMRRAAQETPSLPLAVAGSSPQASSSGCKWLLQGTGDPRWLSWDTVRHLDENGLRVQLQLRLRPLARRERDLQRTDA